MQMLQIRKGPVVLGSVRRAISAQSAAVVVDAHLTRLVTWCIHRCVSAQTGNRRSCRMGKTRTPNVLTCQCVSYTLYLQSSCNQSHGLRTNWSSTNQHCCGRIHFCNRSTIGWNGFIKHPCNVRLVSHEAEDVGRNRADFIRIDHGIRP